MAIPVGTYWLYRQGKLFQRLDWVMYLLAVGVAFFLWEMPVTTLLFLMGEDGSGLCEPSSGARLGLAALISLSASLWDGGIVVAGLLLVRRLLESPHFTRFRTAEAAIIIGWSVAFAFLVETLAVIFNLWAYPVYWWNPPLYAINGRQVVFCATLGWVPIALIFYLLVLKIQKQLQASA